MGAADMKREIEYYKSYICVGIKESATRWQLVISTAISGIIPWLVCAFMAEDSPAAVICSVVACTLPLIIAAYIYSFTGSPGIYHLVKADVLRAASVYITYDISIVLLLDKMKAKLSIIICSVIIPAVVFAAGIALKLLIIYSGRYKRSGSLGVSISGCFALGYIIAQYANSDYSFDFSDMFGYRLLSAVCFFIVIAMSIKITDVLKLCFIRRIERCGYNIEELIIRDIKNDGRKRPL